MASRQRSLRTLVVLAVFMFSATGVRAQQPAAPDPAQLYAQMIAAMQQAGSVHVQLTTPALPTDPRQTIQQQDVGSADISAQQQLLHVVFTAKEVSVRTHRVVLRQRTQVVAVDGRYGTRNAGSQWWCQTIPPEYWQGATLRVFEYLPVNPQFIGGVTSATVLGTAVWRVKIDLVNRTDTLNIAQDSHRLVRITETSGVKTSASGRLKTVSDFTQYGETVTAQLPPACR